MKMTGLARVGALWAALFLAWPGAAQEAPLGRPGLLAATGLLQTERLDLPARNGLPALSVDVPVSSQVTPQVVTETDDPSVRAVIQFRTEPEGRVIESLVLTEARIEAGPVETRRFALANLLVLRTFPAIAQRSDDARLIAFGPVDRERAGDVGARTDLDPPDAVESIGTISGDTGETLLVRHVGLLFPDREEAVIALVTIDTTRLPIRGNADIHDSYSGRTLDSLRFLPSEPSNGSTAQGETDP
jgi:hypothetical protein